MNPVISQQFCEKATHIRFQPMKKQAPIRRLNAPVQRTMNAAANRPAVCPSCGGALQLLRLNMRESMLSCAGGGSCDAASPETAPGHPHAETVGVVIAPDVAAIVTLTKLYQRQAPHLVPPMD